MALKDITTIEETEQLSAEATFYTEDGGLFRRSGVDAVKDALGLALESTATKEALLNCFRHVAWIDENGQEYYDALYDALYNIPVSITATFVQGSNTIYNTDPLSTLRQYLVVRATYEDDTVQTVTAYTLSGNLTVGTSTITVSYKGRTATFEVTVTEDPRHITAVFTQGSSVFFTDDSLDMLKANLVVTYYDSAEATGVVLSDSDYTLAGSLVSGTSTVQVVYGGFTTTFTVTTLENIAGAFADWVHPTYETPRFVINDGILSMTAILETDLTNWSVWIADTRTNLWSGIIGHNVNARIKIKRNSADHSEAEINAYLSIFKNAEITSMAGVNRKSKSLGNIIPATTGQYVTLNFDIGTSDWESWGSSLVPDANSTFGILMYCRTYDTVEISEFKMGLTS